MNLLKNQKGFSLVEVVVTTAILTLVLVPLVTTLAQSQKAVYYGKDYLEADNLISQAAEEVKATSLNSLQDQTITHYKGSKYTLLETVQNVSWDDKNALRQVKLILKDGSKIRSQLDFVVYAKGV